MFDGERSGRFILSSVLVSIKEKVEGAENAQTKKREINRKKECDRRVEERISGKIKRCKRERFVKGKEVEEDKRKMRETI